MVGPEGDLAELCYSFCLGKKVRRSAERRPVGGFHELMEEGKMITS